MALDSAAVYNQLNTESKTTTKEEALKLIDLLSPKENDKVLDIGCGTGEITSILAERVGSGGKVVGIDPDRERVNIANEKYSRSNLEFLEGDSKNFPEDQYDIVFSIYVFHRIKDKEATFKKVSQNMRPGGKFGFTHPERNPQMVVDLSYLMGPDKGKAIVDTISYLESAERYETLGSSNGLVLISKTFHSQVFETPNLDVLCKFWSGITHGAFDLTAIDKDAQERFKQQYGTGPFKFISNLVSFTFTKP